MPFRTGPLRFCCACVSVLAVAAAVRGWDEPGHVIVTELAFDALPADFPAWAKTTANRRRLCYLSAEPDRWRGQNAVVLDHINAPDHYFDIEDLEKFELTLDRLPRFRNAFIEHLERFRTLHPDRFTPPNPARDKSHTSTVPGVLPYAIEEMRWKIASSWSTLRTFERYSDVATPEELAAARNDVIQHMGLISHFVGDSTQPLHLTRHFNGWAGENPKGYTTSKKFHQYIDGGVIELHGITAQTLRARRHPPTPFDPDDAWPQILACLRTSLGRVEPLYAMEKSGALQQAEGKRFIEDCLLEGGGNLSGIWLSAYRASKIDDFLAKKLSSRKPRRAATSQPTASH